jgi:hypothetical protein
LLASVRVAGAFGIMKIDRRKFIGWMGLAGGATLGTRWLGGGNALAAATRSLSLAADAADQTTQTRWQRSAARKLEQTKDVTWLTHEPLDFLLRRGDHFDDEPARYAQMIDPDNIKRIADAGVVWSRIFFYKGFGLEYEKPHIDQAKIAADLMHQLGMKVSLYVGGTMFTETFYRETPEAVNWEQRDQWDHWVPYGIQTYRHYACPNEPAYRDYIKRVIKIGVQDLRADELAFDNIMLQAEPESCRCPRCMKAFGEFLRRGYPTTKAATRRFGLPDTDWIRLNQWDSPEQPLALEVLDDPVLQEWTRFRCETLGKYSNDFYDYTKSLNPNTAVHFNIKGVYSFNRYWTNAVYHPFYAGRIDVMSFDTVGYDEHIDFTGALVSQIRSYKIARRLGTSCEDAFDNDVRAAVHLAFGYQKPGLTATPNGGAAFNVFTPLMEFFREYNDRYFTATDNVADVAVLRNWPSMAYSISAAYVPATLMEQVLIQHKVPFDLLFEEQLDGIANYSAVILAGQECVSDAQAALLLQYVRNGGTLVIAANTGQFNQWREEHTGPSSLFPAVAQAKGRIVYIPTIIPGPMRGRISAAGFQNPEPGVTAPASAQRGVQMIPAQWVLPANHQEIYDTIVGAIPAGLSVTSEAPLTTVMELLNRAKSNETIVHFVNFDTKNPVAPFAVTLRKQFSGPVKSVTVFSPESDDPRTVSFKESAGSINFTAPAMRIYAMIVVAH